MTATTNRWKLGLFVIIGTAALVTGLSMFGVSRLQRQTHPVWAFFDEEVTGLESGSAVRFRGVLIGNVDDVAPAVDRRHIAVRMQWFDDKLSGLGLDPDKLEAGELPPDMRAQIVTYALTQTAFVQVGFFPDGTDGPQVVPFPVPKATLPTVRGTYSNLEAGLRQVPQVLDKIKLLLDQLQDDLAAMQLPELSRRAQATLDQLDAKVKRFELQPLVEDGRAAMHELLDLVKSLRGADGPLQRLFADADALVQQGIDTVRQTDAAATAEHLRQATDRVGGAADEVSRLSRDASAALLHLRATLQSIDRLATLLERDPGALLHGRSPSASPLKKD